MVEVVVPPWCTGATMVYWCHHGGGGLSGHLHQPAVCGQASGLHQPGVPVYWCTGVLVYWCTGVLVYWCTGALVHWCTGVLVTAVTAGHQYKHLPVLETCEAFFIKELFFSP